MSRLVTNSIKNRQEDNNMSKCVKPAPVPQLFETIKVVINEATKYHHAEEDSCIL
ncbi:hypothetical protein MOUN0_H05666 [Monosporozyma unispora]